MARVSFKVAKKAILFISGENEHLHKPSGHGYSGRGSMKLLMTDQFFLLGLYSKDPSRPLYSYVHKLHAFSGMKVSKSTLSSWFHSLFVYKASCRKPCIFPEQKFSSENFRKLNYYIELVSYFDHRRFVFTDEKPMKGCDIYNKYVRCSPLDGSVPYVDTGFDIHNNYNLMAAIKIDNENMENTSEGTSSISYQIGKFKGDSTAFNFFVTQLAVTGFLCTGDILNCDNATIHLTEENKNLVEILWEEKRILFLNLPPYTPELNPIELIFQLLGHCLQMSNARHLCHQMKNDDFFVKMCRIY